MLDQQNDFALLSSDGAFTERLLSYGVVLLVCLFFGRNAGAADQICAIGSEGVVTFAKDARIIPYKRIFVDSTWAIQEESVEDSHRYPITGMSTSSGRSDPTGLYVSGYQSDYFPVDLARTRDPMVFRMNRMMWPAPSQIYSPRNRYIETYSSKDVSWKRSNVQYDLGRRVILVISLTPEQALYFTSALTGVAAGGSFGSASCALRAHSAALAS
jgi:hypothetical protein